MFCSKCGTKLKDVDRFCWKCGFRINRYSAKGDKLPELDHEPEIDAIREPILVLNVGWMEKYSGLENDELTDGGAFVVKHGSGGEIFNFLPFRGSMYGYVQPPGRKMPYNSRIIKIERLGAGANSSLAEGVLVAWIAKKPGGGTYLVGWYQKAIVFKNCQPLPEGMVREFQGEEPLGYYVRAPEDESVLLKPGARTLRVPRASDSMNRGQGGIGQANVWFADSGKRNDLKFRRDLNRFIQTYLPR